jgi:hypothetical protein
VPGGRRRRETRRVARGAADGKRLEGTRAKGVTSSLSTGLESEVGVRWSASPEDNPISVQGAWWSRLEKKCAWDVPQGL